MGLKDRPIRKITVSGLDPLFASLRPVGCDDSKVFRDSVVRWGRRRCANPPCIMPTQERVSEFDSISYPPCNLTV